MDAIQKQVRRARGRLIVERFLGVLGSSLLWPLVAAAAVIGLNEYYAWWDLPLAPTLGIAAGIGVALAMVRTWLGRPPLATAAVELDKRYGLKERVSSAMAMSTAERETPFGKALFQDAVQRVQKLDIGERFRVAVRPTLLLPLVPVGLAVLLVFFIQPAAIVPQAQANSQSQQITQQDKEKLQKVKKELAQRAEKAKQQGLEEAQELFKKLEQEIRDTENQKLENREQALVKLNNLAKELEQRRQQVGSADKLKDQMERLKDMGQGPADKLAKALKDGDFQKAADEVKKLQEQLKNEKLEPEQKEQLANQMQQMQEKLQKLADQQKQAKEDLQKQIEQAQKEGSQQKTEQLKQQLQQMAQQDPQMQKLKDLADKLGQCQQCMKQGDSQQAQQQLAEAEKSLQDLAKQMNESKMLDQAMEDLQQAKCDMCEGKEGQQGKDGFGKKPSSKMGQGKGQKNGDPGNGLGAGQGAGDRPEQETPGKTVDRHVKPKVTKGAAIVTGYVDGPNIKGEVAAEIQGQVQAARSDEADPLTDQRLPRGYREHATKYFDKLRGGKE